MEEMFTDGVGDGGWCVKRVVDGVGVYRTCDRMSWEVDHLCWGVYIPTCGFIQLG